MATFLLCGKYSAEALKGISADRTKHATSLVDKCGGKVKAMYATLGESDLVLVLELPDIEAAMKVSIGLNKMTGVAFTTCPALAVEKFDEFAAEA